jgi:LPS export ABC transporter protein LptC
VARSSQGFFNVKLTLSTLLAIAVLAVLWLTLGQGEQLPTIPLRSEESITENYMSEVHIVEFSESGSMETDSHVDLAKKYTQDPKIYLGAIRALSLEDSAERWLLNAGSGIYSPHARELWLRDGVELKQVGSQSLLQTPRMRVLIDQERAINDAVVSLKIDDSLTTARGIEINLNSGTARLLSNVKTLYKNRP